MEHCNSNPFGSVGETKINSVFWLTLLAKVQENRAVTAKSSFILLFDLNNIFFSEYKFMPICDLVLVYDSEEY